MGGELVGRAVHGDGARYWLEASRAGIELGVAGDDSDRLEEMGHDEAVYRPSIPRGRKARVVGLLRCPHLSVGGSVLSPGLTRVICDLEVTNKAFLPLLEASWRRVAFSIDGEGESVRDFH